MARGLGRRKRTRVQAEVQRTLAEFAAAVEVRLHAELDRSRQTQLTLIDSVRTLRQEVGARDTDLARALDGVGQAIDHAAEVVDSDRLERRALVEALGSLTREVTERPFAYVAPDPPDRVIGGSFSGGELREAGAVHRGVEVQCRFGSRWVDGFEVCEVVVDGDALRYRVRRQSDGSVLPKLLEAGEVRHRQAAIGSGPGSQPHRSWSRRTQ
jgi:hypothetical protein